MISKEQFVEVIDALQLASNFLDESYKLCVDLYDIEPLQSLYKLESILFSQCFKEEAIDTIYWWLYEYDKIKPGMWDSNHDIIPMQTIDDLWNYVKDYLK